MKRFLPVLAVLLVLSIVPTGCKRTQSAAGGDRVQIALLMRNMDEQFLKDYADNVRKMAAERGVDLNIQDARSQNDTQLTQLETLLNQGYKYFVIIPCISELSESMNPLIQAKGGAASYSNTPPTTASLKVGTNFFFASSPELVAGRYHGQLI